MLLNSLKKAHVALSDIEHSAISKFKIFTICWITPDYGQFISR